MRRPPLSTVEHLPATAEIGSSAMRHPSHAQEGCK